MIPIYRLITLSPCRNWNHFQYGSSSVHVLAAKEDSSNSWTFELWWATPYLSTSYVQPKLKDLNQLSCRTWNRLMLGCNPGYFFFILCPASDTLPTSVYSKHWHIQWGSKCTLRGYRQPATAHILSSCSVALWQICFTYHHDKVQYCLATELLKHFAEWSVVSLYADLPEMCENDCMIPLSLLIILHHPNLVIYN